MKKQQRVRHLTKITFTIEELAKVLEAAERRGYEKRRLEEQQARIFAEIKYNDRTPNDPLTLVKWWGNHTGDSPPPQPYRFPITA